ncbi:hypothetical protein SUGI_0550720 [Cryptomeria japonica]|nr:hypothetical protein SUGI_0550720 [Cryptomeria japonica]
MKYIDIRQRESEADVAKAILHNLIKPFKNSDFEIFIPKNSLFNAVYGGYPEILDVVLTSPAWKDELMVEEDGNGRCGIHVAAVKGRLDIVNEFMSRLPDCVEIRRSNRKSVLHFAVEYSQFDMLRNLLLNKSENSVTFIEYRNPNQHLANC